MNDKVWLKSIVVYDNAARLSINEGELWGNTGTKIALRQPSRQRVTPEDWNDIIRDLRVWLRPFIAEVVVLLSDVR